MRIVGGHTIEVYRTTKDRFGDVTEETFLGTIENVVFQWAHATSVGLRFHPTDNFQETWDVSAAMYIPRDAAVQIEDKDRIKMNGRTYQVVGDRAWAEDHPMTGTNFGYCMVQVEVAG